MPNILMIAVDDLNAWATVLGSYAAPLDTPNLDRLRAMGVNFTNANAAVPLCNPARAAVLTGMSPLSSGIFDNTQDMFDHVSVGQTLPAQLHAAGFHTVLAGKVFHDLTEAQAAALFDRVLSTTSTGAEYDRGQRTPAATQAPAGIYTGDPALLSDARNVTLALDVLANHVPQPGSAGLFLSVGLTSTHLPWAVPKAYFDRYPLDGIVLPEVPPNDLDDLPDFALQFIDSSRFERVLGLGEWKQLVQAYLATMAFMDDMVGRLLDGLAASAIADDTMVVFWSDHGFHLGDKEMVTTKLSLWEPATRAPLIIADPGASARAGQDEARVVSMLDVYSTILDYAGVAIPAWADGQSLLGLIRTGDGTGLANAAVTLIDGNFSLRTEQFRYTRYEDGSVELYDMLADPRQFTNLAGDAVHAGTLARMSAQLDAYLGQFDLQQNRGAAPQRLEGGPDRDILIAGFGADTLAGGAGDDVYLLRNGAETVLETAAGGTDTIILGAARAPFRLPDHVERLQLGRAGENQPEPAKHVLYGNALDNTINLFPRAPVWLDAGAGDDTVFAPLAGRGARGPLTATILGGEGDDSIIAGNNADLLFGGAGNDTLDGGVSGGDSLDGGEGNDSLSAALGRDTLDGGAGDDRLGGGEAGDVYVVSDGMDAISETGATGADILDVTRWGMSGFRLEEVRDDNGLLLAFDYIALDGSGTTSVLAHDGRNPIEALRDRGTTWLVNTTVFVAGDDDDRVIGTAAGDVLRGMGDHDALRGEAGADTLDSGRGADTLQGGGGDDSLTGGAGQDHFLVEAGTDTITDLGAGGADVLIVSAGSIAIATAGATFRATALTSNSGQATLHAGGFSVNLAEATGLAGWTISNAPSATGAALTGSARADTLVGGSGADTLAGGRGDDRLTGGGGLDSFVVEAGQDTISDLGLGGAEQVRVSAGARLEASLAAAWTAGTGTSNAGAARLDANGFDVNLAAAAGPLGWLVSNAGHTQGISLTGSASHDTLIGGAGHDRLLGGGGRDHFVVDAGSDAVLDLGAGGFDTLDVGAGATAQVRLAGHWLAAASTVIHGTVNLDVAGYTADLAAAGGSRGWFVTNSATTGTTVTGSAHADTLLGGTGRDIILGGAGRDLLLGGGDDDRLTGGLGDDTLMGGTGADLLHGSDGADVLSGGIADDQLSGGAGDDTLTGGHGVDRFLVEAGLDTVTDLGAGGADALVVSARAAVTATLDGGFRATAQTSNAGVATLVANGFNANLDAATGTQGWNVTNAGAAAGVMLTGSARADRLTGGNGADTLRGGLGADSLAGGLGADVFGFVSPAAAAGDVILDFNAAQGDVLDLAAMDANGPGHGNGTFAFLGAGAFTRAAGQLRFSGQQLLGDVNGDALADFAITLQGVAALQATNILL